MHSEKEVKFQCPYCFENISMVFETLYGKKSYIEDCEVCCSPIEVAYRVENDEVVVEFVERAQ